MNACVDTWTQLQTTICPKQALLFTDAGSNLTATNVTITDNVDFVVSESNRQTERERERER